MVENNTIAETTKTNSWKEPFEFVLTVNGSIICQRYFQIENYNRTVAKSVQIVDAIKYCVDLINASLKRKTSSYLYKTSPMVFKDKAQCKSWIEGKVKPLAVPSFVVFYDEEDAYVWNGHDIEKYDGRFNRNDYINDNVDNKCDLKFTFKVNGREVCSKCWDGNEFPRFIRTNIDLSNSKNKFKGGDLYLPFECAMVDVLNDEETEDLIPKIVEVLVECCSYSKNADYTTKSKYGDKTYNFNRWAENDAYYRELEKVYRKKTNDYFKSIGYKPNTPKKTK